MLGGEPLITVGQNYGFIKSIIDGMFDWVRVLDKDDNVIFMNKAMADGLQNAKPGSKCYELIGRAEPCENCISRQAVFHGRPHEKEEILDGRTFSVMSSPVRNEAGEIIAVVEVLRDVTQLKQLQKEILRQNTKLQDDLLLARKLQCSMLPRDLPEDKIDFSFIYRPCEALGGDFLDVFRIDGRHLGIYIADVSGHGVSASMLTVFLRSSLNKRLLSPSQALAQLYREFNSGGFDGGLYITVFYAIIDTEERKMVYSNAGHNVCPIVFNKNRLEPLWLPGIPISDWVEYPVYEDAFLTLQQGDRVFLYTDGIVELYNKEGRQFGEERLLEQLLTSKASPSGTLNRLFDAACDFAGLKNASMVPDDITMALLEIK